MNYVYKNNNPIKKRTGDCVIQALCNALDKTWEEVFMGLAEVGLLIYETIESNATWDIYIRNHGFSQESSMRGYSGNGRSYARGRGSNANRDSMGRYSSRGAYSRNSYGRMMDDYGREPYDMY